MKTTVIGAYPKPSYLDIPDWFNSNLSTDTTIATNNYIKTTNRKKMDRDIYRAIEEIIIEQKELDIDIITDGEIQRENYIYSFCRTLNGIDFNLLNDKSIRNEASIKKCPTIVSKITNKENIYHSNEWLLSNEIALKHIQVLKFTIPGPMTICDSLFNSYYKNDEMLCFDLSQLIRREVLYLKSIGCRNIQIDEPLFARNPNLALKWGIDLLNNIIDNIDNIFFTLHICCGYPEYLDQKDYKKASSCSYNILAEQLEKSKINAISIEDAHCHLDLSFLSKIKSKKIVFGTIAVANSQIETVDEIKTRIQEALKYVEKERLIISPDCGLGYLPKNIAYQKLKNMVEAAKSF